jgi:hypothetical protein
MQNNARRALVLSAALLAFSMTAVAGEVAGVKMANSATVEGKTLALNGMGLRTKAIFKVYVAGLYTEKASKDANAIVASDSVKRVEMVMLRDLGKSKIAEAVVEGFEKNSKAEMPKLQERLNRFVAQIPDLKEGQKLIITYAPGKGTTLSANGRDAISVPGKDFADALFSVWLGKHPVDETLKKGMLGV